MAKFKARPYLFDKNRELGISTPTGQCDKCRADCVTIGGLCWDCFCEGNHRQEHKYNAAHVDCRLCDLMDRYV